MIHVRLSALTDGTAGRALSRRVVCAVATGAHGVLQLARSIPQLLRTVRPPLPSVASVVTVLVLIAGIVVGAASDRAPNCVVSPGPTQDAVFAIPPPPGSGDQFHVWGGEVHTWLHETAGLLEVVEMEAEDPCYPYGDGQWGVADVSGDGRSDLVHVTEKGVNSWIAQGGGAYHVEPAGTSTAGEGNVAGVWGAADIDADRDADLIHITEDGVQAWTGDGEGGFALGPTQAGPRPAELVKGQWRVDDVDGDRRKDLVHVLDRGVETWFSRPGGSFDVKLAPAPYPYLGGTWLTGDVTVDGRADLIHVIRGQVERGNTTSRGKGAVVTWVSLGDGRFMADPEPQNLPGRHYRYGEGEWFAANMDEDPAVEVVHQYGAGVTIWDFQGAGRYARRATPLPQARSASETVMWQVGDLQADGWADLMQICDDSVQAWISRPDGGFTHARSPVGQGYGFRRGAWLGTSGPR